ncbi:sugar transferase [Microvirga sp. G4-2]|uniref:sugar transferase n=1 Tax=Microvirga sp. G4-2 TaxID=3434467 RepID=UPI0040443B6A
MFSESRTSSLLPKVQGTAQSPALHASFESKLKRGFDIVFATLMIFLLFPMMILIALLIWSSSEGPILFRQKRVGIRGRSFGCLKFRTMVPNADRLLQELLDRSPEAMREWEQSFKLKNDPRITPIGHFLRKTSLDELPQLFNVIAGEMSLVGPRPIVTAELPRYGDALQLYLSVRPGLTGLWQINGRSDCSYPERVALDLEYLRTWSFQNDVVIMIRTVGAILSGRGSC